MMKKTPLLIALTFIVSTLIAQDIIYTISGELNNEKVPLDSILVENLTNKTWISFNDLPEEEYYQINLTKNSYWGTTYSFNLEKGQLGFTESLNQPGEIVLFYSESVQTDASISIYNLKGQKVHSTSKQIISPGQSVIVKLGRIGVFLIELRTNAGSQTFKAIGLPHSRNMEVSIQDFFEQSKSLKSIQFPFSSGFQYGIGDTLRVSVFKHDNYASPLGLTIYESESLNFIFEKTSDTIAIASGVINGDELNNLNLSDLTVDSYINSTKVNINGTFNTSNEIESGKQLPILFSNGDDLLFGYHPEQDNDGTVDLDDILLFYFSLYPEIPIRDIELDVLRDLMQIESNYENLKLQLKNLLHESKSPLDNELFIQTLQNSAESIIELNENQQKSAADLNEVGHLQFKFNRNGLITYPTGLPMYAYVGLEIKKDGQRYVEPKLFKKSKIILSPTSIIGWFFDKIFAEEIPEAQTIQLTEDGLYSFSFTNSKTTDNVSYELYDYVRDKNNKLFVVNALSFIFPLTVEELFTNKCNQNLTKMFVEMNLWLAKSLESDGMVTTGEVSKFLADISKRTAGIIANCVPDIPKHKYLTKILKAANILGKIERGSTMYLFIKDYHSQISGIDTINFYDNVAFTELRYKLKSEKDFEGAVGEEYWYDLYFEEKIDSFSIVRDILKTTFIRKSKWKGAGDLPVDLKISKGNANYVIGDNFYTKSNGQYNGIIKLGEQDSEVTVNPPFKNSKLEPVSILLKSKSNFFTYNEIDYDLSHGYLFHEYVDDEIDYTLLVLCSEDRSWDINADEEFPGTGSFIAFEISSPEKVGIFTRNNNTLDDIWFQTSPTQEIEVIGEAEIEINEEDGKFEISFSTDNVSGYYNGELEKINRYFRCYPVYDAWGYYLYDDCFWEYN